MDFVANIDFDAPYVRITGQPHRPQVICKKHFRKGEIITGEIKTVKGRPSLILHKGVIPIPVSFVKQVITKNIEMTSNADAIKVAKDNPKVEVRVPSIVAQKKKKAMDGAIIGAIIGVVAVVLAEKKGWMNAEEKKNKLYGALVGAFLGGYYVYRS